jgi:hypothetical protein
MTPGTLPENPLELVPIMKSPGFFLLPPFARTRQNDTRSFEAVLFRLLLSQHPSDFGTPIDPDKISPRIRRGFLVGLALFFSHPQKRKSIVSF